MFWYWFNDMLFCVEGDKKRVNAATLMFVRVYPVSRGLL